MSVNFNILGQGVPAIDPTGGGTMNNAANILNAVNQRDALRADAARNSALNNILSESTDPTTQKFNYELAASALIRGGFIKEAKMLTEVRGKMPTAKTPEEQFAVYKDAITVLPAMAQLAKDNKDLLPALMPGFKAVLGPDVTLDDAALDSIIKMDSKKVGKNLKLVDTEGGKKVIDMDAVEPGQFFPGNPEKPAAAPAAAKPFGSGAQGQALSALIDLRAKERAGQELTPEEQDMKAAAMHILQTEKVAKDANGNMVTYTPGLPPGFDQPAAPGASPVAPAASGAPPATNVPGTPPAPGAGGSPAAGDMSGGPTRTPGGGTIDVVDYKDSATEKKVSGARQKILNQISSITGIVAEAKKAGENILGVEGALRASKAGQISRQAGTNVTPRAARLQGKLEILTGLLSEPVMGESRLSNEERNRLKSIVTDLKGGSLDEPALQAMLLDLLEIARGM